VAVEVVAMRAVIVYESLFGNTHKIATAVGEGIRAAAPAADVAVLDAGAATAELIGSADLLVVGAPTHMRGLSTSFSRRAGVRDVQKKSATGAGSPAVVVDPAADGPGVRDLLRTLPPAPPGARAAAFDTRGAVRLAGGAARSVARHLSHAGYRLAAPPEGFVIEDSPGPLRAGEEDRARAWAAKLL
jgi:hypothetical protein